MKKILPIEANPPVSYNPGFAQPLSILYSGKIRNPDLYLMDRFIQLYFEKQVCDDEKNALAFFLPGESIFSLLDMETVDDEELTDHDIISRVCIEIRRNHYIQMMLQEYCIPGALFYKKNDIIHQHLIFGFDDAKRIFYALCHKENRRFGILEIKFEDFLMAYNKRDSAPYSYVKIKPMKNVFINFKRDEYLKDSLYDYLHGENRFVFADSEPAICGVDIYGELIHFLHLGQIDMRDYQALLQHKQIMSSRISGYLNLSSLGEQYKKVLGLAVRTHSFALKWSLTQQEKDISRIETTLYAMKQLEIAILSEVYTNVKQPRRTAKEKNNHKIVRPYNLDTKVRDTLWDVEVWDILEEYIPGVRNNSQLPLVYGMRLKKLIGKGHYVGVTPEQEKEFLERILALRSRE
ncbi:MAG: hypothetical protein LBB34_03685 [Holosporales bacterium]|nr:hypothetical protein [Holosporales bacterium]